ncbi:Sporulation kinase E [Fundidesulfovibrio magnetotacticus]|uniref:histidine kinase n=2 Tax=Fundidesulfovibrio magnetotacticus TaxID=2730080 RepID=A0A6V8LS62_9BACT|nr:Sporulation kinase E [Fundidesulfovibrio magnetotacticus]
MLRYKPPLSRLISLTLFSVVTTVLVSVGAADYLAQRNTHLRGLRESVESTARQLASALALPIWNFQEDLTRKIVDNALQDRAVVAVAVHDSVTGSAVVVRRRDAQGELRDASGDEPPLGEIHVFQPITYNGRLIGSVDVHATDTHVIETLRGLMLKMLLGIVLMNLLVVGLLHIVLDRLVVRPLKAVENYAAHVSSSEDADALPPVGALPREVESLSSSIVVMVRKLRERYEALAASRHGLAEAESRYRDLYENALAGIFRSLPDGRLISANSAMARILGYESPDDLVASITDLGSQMYLRACDRDRLLNAVARLGQVSNFRFPFRRADGDVRQGLIHVRAAQDGHGRFLHYDGILEDITERTRAEERLLAAHAFIQNILDSMPSVVIGVDEALHVTHCNKGALAATGLPAESLLGRRFDEVLPRLGAHLEAVRTAMRENKPVSLDSQAYEHDGEQRQEDVLVFPASTGSTPGAVIRLDDVTAKTRMEKLILQTEKMMSLGGLAAGMAHEINNPLAGVLQGVQNISRRLSPDLPANQAAARKAGCPLEAVRRYVEDREILDFLTGIRESGERAARIVANMLSFTRRAQEQSTPVNLTELLDRSLELASTDYDLKRKFDFKQVEIVRDYAPGVPPTPCSPMEIEQVVVNLLRNAAQAIFAHPPADGQPRIRLGLRREGGHAVIEVEDNGPGIDPANLRKVFEPFFTTKPPGEGTGLGLSVSYFIVTRNHGGTIRVENAEKGGARFVIALPLARETACLD